MKTASLLVLGIFLLIGLAAHCVGLAIRWIIFAIFPPAAAQIIATIVALLLCIPLVIGVIKYIKMNSVKRLKERS